MSQRNSAVFFSYASQDAPAVRRICDALRAGGIEVWLDQSELRGGDAWDQQIRQQIRACALFMPVISAHTQARLEGYFRREWRLAVDRMQDMADDKAFLVPVVIDDSAERGSPCARRLSSRALICLPGGETQPPLHNMCRGCWSAAFLWSGASSSTRFSSHAGAGVPTCRGPGLSHSAGKPSGIVARWGCCGRRGLLAFEYFEPSRAGAGLLDDAATSARSITAERRARLPAETNSVAVLPFADLSPGKDQEYLSDGIAEQIMSALAEVGGLRALLRVLRHSHSKARRSPSTRSARRLRVAHIIEGSVRGAGDRLRVTVRLIDVSNGFEVWSNSYDRKLHDILAVQEDISRSIIERLHVQLTGEEQSALTRSGRHGSRRPTTCI